MSERDTAIEAAWRLGGDGYAAKAIDLPGSHSPHDPTLSKQREEIVVLHHRRDLDATSTSEGMVVMARHWARCGEYLGLYAEPDNFRSVRICWSCFAR